MRCEKSLNDEIQATVKFTALSQYEACWPVRELIKMRLKVTSEKERTHRDKEVIEEVMALTFICAPVQ